MKKTRNRIDRTEEADKVVVRIAKILSERAFSFTPNEYISIHKKLFAGIYGHAGKIRDYNITKKEWVLNGATVLYGRASELRVTLDYDFSEEKKFSYKNLTMDEKNELHNRSMHNISGVFEKEVDIEDVKVDIRNKLLSFSNRISEKTVNHALEIFSKCGEDVCFGRTMIEDITGLKSLGAAKLIKLLLDSNVIIPVTGHGKGKYRFR